jgi:hypothetical protein
MGEVRVIEPEGQGGPSFVDHLARRNGKEQPTEPTGNKAVDQIGDAVQGQHPHAQEMPLKGVLRPDSENDVFRKMQKSKQNFVIVDFPSTHNHDDHVYRIRPMHYPYGKWVHKLISCHHLLLFDCIYSKKFYI